GRFGPAQRVTAGDAQQVAVRRRRADALEEAIHLEAPALEVGTQDGRLLRIDQLDGAERLAPPPETQLSAARGPQVADPLRLAARRDEVALPVADQEIDRHDAPLARLPSAHGEVARSPQADSEPGEEARDGVEDLVCPREPHVALLRHLHLDRPRSGRRALGGRDTSSAAPPPRPGDPTGARRPPAPRPCDTTEPAPRRPVWASRRR